MDYEIAKEIIGMEQAALERWSHGDPYGFLEISAPDALRAKPRDAGNSIARAFMAARSRYAGDQIASAVRHGADQCVVLGAGLDTFAYRNPHSGLRVFEVDHPATQVWKRERLRAASIPIPPSLTFVSIDFERQTLAAGLEDEGRRATLMRSRSVCPSPGASAGTRGPGRHH